MFLKVVFLNSSMKIGFLNVCLMVISEIHGEYFLWSLFTWKFSKRNFCLILLTFAQYCFSSDV